ncbi:MAG: acyltransferase family protein [Bacteroidales bacterium]|nr:acyltransferase family protein [Candidatus Scybalocola fimicaballi]
MNNFDNGRIHWVDFYKAFSIFLIVLGHAFLNFEQLIHFLFLFHVPLFFFISGYLEKTNECDAKEYLRKSKDSLIVPYFLWNVLCVVFHAPTFKGITGVLTGMKVWNGASWFLGVLLFMKIFALTLRNKKYYISTLLLIVLGALFFINVRMPFYINLTFMYMPFFFVGMYGKKQINCLVEKFGCKVFLNLCLVAVCIATLIYCFQYTGVTHTNAVVDFADTFYLYWLTGFVGIASMFFLCICFYKIQNSLVESISVSTLFIMCSHYEVIQLVTRYITPNYGDVYSIAFVMIYFAIQCALIPVVLKKAPILAGRKK